MFYELLELTLKRSVSSIACSPNRIVIVEEFYVLVRGKKSVLSLSQFRFFQLLLTNAIKKINVSIV